MKKILFLTVLLATLLNCPSPSFAGITPEIVDAIILTESSNRAYAVSRDNCRGLGQIKEETWYWICELMGVNWHFNEAFNPNKNRQVTVYYLKWLENYLKKRGVYSEELLFACYNAGQGAVRRYGWRIPPFPETQHYVKKVKRNLLKIQNDVY